MGVKNKQRRAAKKKARQRGRPSRGAAEELFVAQPIPELVRMELLKVIGKIATGLWTPHRGASLLLHPAGPLPPELAPEGLRSLLADLVVVLTRNGWTPSDLVQITTRRADERHVPALVGLLAAEAGRHPTGRVDARWRADLAAAGPARSLDLTSESDVRAALELAVPLTALPAITRLVPPPGEAQPVAAVGGSGDSRLLAKVRSLLAKAESTAFDEEAEALSAKAQELVSRHSLERLLAEADGERGAPTVARRIWIDAPYVFAKSLLVHVVADANRCRSVVSEQLGFCTVVGRSDDLDAVDLLVTSLLVQANAAMLRFGRQTDGSGTSRTRSFRQSFLVSYSGRISERLHAVADGAADSTGRAGQMVPVLRRQQERVDATCAELFPNMVTKEATIGNAKGWAAGRAAADLALFDTDLQITPAAS